MGRSAIAPVLALVLLAACGSPEPGPETPTEAAGAIAELYRARDFDALVRTRYAEIAKAENDEQVRALVERFRSRFESDEALAQAVSTYESLQAVEPEMSDDGRVATFRVQQGFVKLSRMPDGRWGFHL
jgi:hypothetical protein